MCVVCGCGRVDEPVAGQPRVDMLGGDLDFDAGPARVSVPGLGAARAIRLEADVLGENDRVAARNRAHFAAHGVTALNLVSSPGAGKTTLLCTTIRLLQACEPGLAMAVIEGDQQTRRDADRIRATGVPAIQVNTGKGCHLDAPMVEAAFAGLPLHRHGHGRGQGHGGGHDHDHAPHPAHHHHHGGGLLFIENVGNLVCPAMWDLGEAAKVVVLSVTEGDDKPGKYPDMFAAAQLMVVNKIDLLPHVDFDLARCVADARRVNPSIEVLTLSATRRDGMNAWLDWLLARLVSTARSGAPCA